VTPGGLRQLSPGERPGDEPEVVLLMGIQGAGKSEFVQQYIEKGYVRLNRDQEGGSLDDLVPLVGESLAAGKTRVVLDNTYPTRVSRYAVIRMAHAHRVPVRCRFLNTPLNEAYQNVVLRILERYGRLLGPDDLKELSKTDPNLPPRRPWLAGRPASSHRRSTRDSRWWRRFRLFAVPATQGR